MARRSFRPTDQSRTATSSYPASSTSSPLRPKTRPRVLDGWVPSVCRTGSWPGAASHRQTCTAVPSETARQPSLSETGNAAAAMAGAANVTPASAAQGRRRASRCRETTSSSSSTRLAPAVRTNIRGPRTRSASWRTSAVRTCASRVSTWPPLCQDHTHSRSPSAARATHSPPASAADSARTLPPHRYSWTGVRAPACQKYTDWSSRATVAQRAPSPTSRTSLSGRPRPSPLRGTRRVSSRTPTPGAGPGSPQPARGQGVRPGRPRRSRAGAPAQGPGAAGGAVRRHLRGRAARPSSTPPRAGNRPGGAASGTSPRGG